MDYVTLTPEMQEQIINSRLAQLEAEHLQFGLLIAELSEDGGDEARAKVAEYRDAQLVLDRAWARNNSRLTRLRDKAGQSEPSIDENNR